MATAGALFRNRSPGHHVSIGQHHSAGAQDLRRCRNLSHDKECDQTEEQSCPLSLRIGTDCALPFAGTPTSPPVTGRPAFDNLIARTVCHQERPVLPDAEHATAPSPRQLRVLFSTVPEIHECAH